MRTVIIGAGVMGASVAFHLTVNGCRDVVLLDRAPEPGHGSTGRATGGFRAQYGSAINIRLSLLAREKLRRFAQDTGGDAGYRPVGYLWIASSPAQLSELHQGLQLQHREGLSEASAVDAADVMRLNPALAGDGIVGGAFCPTDGFIRPLGILHGYLEAARRNGARALWNTEVIGIERDRTGRVVSLNTVGARVEGDVFVNAAGAWAGELGRVAGVDLPVVPLRRQVASTDPTDVLPDDMPMTIFAEDGFHLRVRDGRVLLLWPTPGVPGHPFETSVDSAWVERVTEMARRRLPVLGSVGVDRGRCWAGLYEMSPDKHAILGPAPGVANLYLINGSSGHGVMHAPALGHLLAEMILHGHATTLDVSPLRPERFAEGDPHPDSGVL